MANNFSTTYSTAATGESTLSVTRDDLRRYVRRYLGISRTGSLDTDDEADVSDAIKTGERAFYHPEVLPGETTGHIWSFMNPLMTLSLTAPYSTGTVSITTGTVTLTGGTWPSWAADGTLVVDGSRYEVDTRTSNSVIVLEDTSVTGVSGETYELEHWRYSLPDGFGAFNTPSLSFSEDANVWRTLWLTGVGEVLQMRQQYGPVTVSTQPELAAVQTVTSDHTAGTRYELWLYPTPQSTYTVKGQYTVNPNAVSSGAPYPLGGMPVAETLIASCLCAAERMMNDTSSVERENFLNRLRASIALDRKMHAPAILGTMNNSNRRHTVWHQDDHYVSVNNQFWLGE